MNVLDWTTTKPVFGDDSKPCLLATKSSFGDYTLYEVRKEDGEDDEGNQGYYWAIFLDGEELDEYDVLVAERYALMEYAPEKTKP